MRADTSCRCRSVLDDLPDQPELVPDEAGLEKASADVLAPGPAKGAPCPRVAEQVKRLSRAGGDAVHEVALVALGKLHRDPARASRHHRRLLPERLGHDQPEAFAQ